MVDFVVGPGAKPSEYKTVPLWQVRGWTNTPRGLEGRFKTRHGEYWGLIKILSRAKSKFYIFQPPRELEHHPQHHCFFPIGNGWFDVHFDVGPDGIDDGIIQIESILTNALSIRP